MGTPLESGAAALENVFFEEKSSPEWISTALCLFAVSTKYVAMTTKDSHHSHAGMNRWLRFHSLEKQAKECHRFLRGVKEPAKNPFNISEDHRQAFDFLFRGICQHCPDTKSSSRKKAKEPVGDTTKPGFVAVLHFVKGITALVVSLDVQLAKTEEYFHSARETEPEYFFWWYNLLLRERHLRRDLAATNVNGASITEWASKAQDLAPDLLKLRTGLVKFLVDLEIAEREGRSQSRDALRYLFKTVNGEHFDPSELHQKWARVKVSELIIRTASTSKEKEDGRELLQECLSASPLCHLTLGALAVLLQTEDPSGSEELLSKAKQICPSANISEIFDFTGDGQGQTKMKRFTSGEGIPGGNEGNSADLQFGSGSQSPLDKDDRTVDPPQKQVYPTLQTPEGSNTTKKGNKKSSNGKGSISARNASDPYDVGNEILTDNQMGSIEPDDRQLLISTCPIECPPVWLAQDVARIRQFSLQKAGSLSTYLHRKLNSKEFRMPQYRSSDDKAPHDDTEEVDGPDSEETPLSPAETGNPRDISTVSDIWYAAKISGASLALYLNKTEVATSLLTNCEEALEGGFKRTTHKKASKYLLDSTKLCVAFINGKSGGPSVKLERAIVQMEKRWQSVRWSSIINLMKGRIADQLGLAHDISLEQYKRAAVLEPQCPLWHQIVYEKLKQMRKSGSNSKYPSSEEIEACQRVHQLNPKNLPGIINLAELKMQRILGGFKNKRDTPCGGYTTEVEEILDMLRKVQKMARPQSRQEMLAMLKVAEVYTAKGWPQRVEEAEEIFKKCLANWPENSMVLHKTGKFYQNSHNDYRKAGDYYEKAVNVSPQNYPCLMDLVRLNGRFLQRYNVIVTLMGRYLSHIRSPEHVVAMLIIKGQACWLQNRPGNGMKKKACQAWLEVFKNYPQLAFKVEEALRNHFSRSFGNLRIPLNEVYPVFANVVRESGLADNRIVSKFLRMLEGSRGRP